STRKARRRRHVGRLASGGSGPVHAAALAAELGAETAVVPPLAGLFSSAGLLFARAEFHDVRFCRVDARNPDISRLRGLEAEMRAHLESRMGDGEGPREWMRSADVRYRGQNW